MATERPLLQVALDFVDLDRALLLAEESVAGGADWIEAGTPLIKSVGLDAVRELKRRFPDKTVVADLKLWMPAASKSNMPPKPARAR